MDKFAAEFSNLSQLAAKIKKANADYAQEKLELSEEERYRRLSEPNAQLDQVLEKILADELARSGPEHFSRDRVWLWGGPTPYWGGSMAPDCALTGARHFGLENVVYVYGALTEENIALHQECRQLICHLGRNCRTPGAQTGSDAEEAARLSKLSLKYPNLRGGVIDDMTANYGHNYSLREYKETHAALQSHNPNLELYGVVYNHELDRESVKILAPCIDHVMLWFWDKTQLVDIELGVEKCRQIFRGKPIMMGLFMYDYGLVGMPNPGFATRFQLEKARRLLAAGKIQDLVILGDREIARCPEADQAIRDFLAAEFGASAPAAKQ